MVFPQQKKGVSLDLIKDLKEAPEIQKFPGFEEFFSQISTLYKETVKEKEEKALAFKDDPTLIFLGTGSMMPSTFRNVSAISVTANDDSHMLLDCGEGTFSQLIDSFGMAEIDNYLRRLRLIYITHIHPDHNLGLFKILAERQALEERLNEKFEVEVCLLSLSSL